MIYFRINTEFSGLVDDKNQQQAGGDADGHLAGKVADKLQIDRGLALEIVELARDKQVEFGRELFECAIITFYAYRMCILKCLRELLLLAYSHNLPEDVHSFASDWVRRWLFPKDKSSNSNAAGRGSFVGRLLKIIDEHRMNLFSLAIEDRLGSLDGERHAEKQKMTISAAYSKMKAEEDWNLSAMMGVRLFEERNLVAKLLALLSWNDFLPVDDAVETFQFVKVRFTNSSHIIRKLLDF